ncbi:MAG: hypothetical protein FJW54_00745 [Actinobacteria bacterium]|nr:hypothetical protein [Actinomycetota bacterium]
MRCYLPLSKSEFAHFIESSQMQCEILYVPTPTLALKYGVSDEEETEYAALELARTDAESIKKPVIVAFELSEVSIASGSEIKAGVVTGKYSIRNPDVIALYLIYGADDELEWYDASESAICLAKIGE